MHLLSLNEDVLRCIFSKLHGEDALNLSLTSSHVHDLAIHRVAAVIVCKTDCDLRLAHRYLFFGSRPRAKYLERLSIYNRLFSIDDDLYDIRPESLPSDDFYHHDWTLSTLVLDMLMNAPNLHHLALPLLHPLLEYDPRFGPALASLHFLSSLKFDAIGDTTVTFLRSLPCAGLLRKLSLTYTSPCVDLYYARNEPTTFRTLLDTLAAFPNLRYLNLSYFDPPAPLLDPGYTPPLFPALLSLDIDLSSPDILYLVQLCPGIQSVGFGTYQNGEPLLKGNDRWPPLRTFDLGHAPYGYSKHARELLQGAYYLQVVQDVSIDDPDREEVTALVDIIRRSSPVGMYLNLKLGLSPVPSFWSGITQIALNLRFLELRLNTHRLTLDYCGWLDKVPDSLRAFNLVSLRILLPRLWDWDRYDELPRVTKATVATLEQDRSQSVKTLPQRLVDAIPTLLFVGVCESTPSASQVHGASDDEDEAEEEEEEDEGETELEAVGEYNPEDEWREGDFRMMETVAYSRWWRVRPDAGGPQHCRLDEMTLAESNRLQYFLRDSTLDDIAAIEDYFP